MQTIKYSKKLLNRHINAATAYNTIKLLTETQEQTYLLCPTTYTSVKVKGNMVLLLTGQWSCDSQVTGSSPGWHHCIVALGKLLTHLCASVTKQYNWYWPQGDLVG